MNISSINLVYFRIIWALIMNAIYAGTIFLIYFVLVKAKVIPYKFTVISTTLINLFIYMQPNLVGGFISLLSKRNLGGVDWV